MKIMEVVKAFEANREDAPRMIETYISDLGLDSKEPVNEDVHQIYLWDALEILFFQYTPSRKWTPRKTVQNWLSKRPRKIADQQDLISAVLKTVNIPQELSLYDFYIPTERIREITLVAVQKVRKEYPSYCPEVPPVVKEFLNPE